MHILMLTHYFEPDSGAAAVRLSRLAKLLRQRGHELTVLTTMPHYPQGRIAEGYRGKWSTLEEYDGLHIIRVWLYATSSPKISRKFISQISFMLTAFWRGLRLPPPDVMLIEAQPVFTNFAGVALSRFMRVPYVLNISDLWPDHLLSVGALKASHPAYRAARWLVDRTYRGAAGITAMSPAWAETIQQYIGRRDNIEVIYNGVDLKRFRPGLDATPFRQKYDLGTGRLVTFIGTFATQYDFEKMLAAAKRLARLQDVRVAFIGGGSQSDTMRQYLSEDQHANIYWIPWINHAEMNLAWAASTVTFWAMRAQDLYRGTIPAKLFEAMASGVPVAAATEGIAADIIRSSGSGATVPFEDVDGLVTEIERLLDDEALYGQCHRAARAYAEQHFDPEKVAAAYEEVLIKAVKSH